MSVRDKVTEPPKPVTSHADQRLMNPLFVSDEGFERVARNWWLSAPLEGGSRERFAREAQEKRPRPEVESRLHAIPWLVLLILASLLFGILGLAANFLAMAGGS